MKPSLHNSSQNHRKDIDGLRAVAVLSVIFFHLEKSIIPGGFVGVDIFFVISGYLISLQIFRDIDRGQFSILEFYRRRIKRIVPAMFVVVLAVIVIAQVILRPSDAERVAESGLWSVMSMANVYFWLFEDSSYFAAASNEKPLLHLWSLGVEEQFYFFWPLILLATYRIGHGKLFFLIVVVVAAFSFFAGEYYFGHDPSFVYYMLPTRAGELLLGALLAQIVIKKGDRVIPEFFVSVIGLLGVLLIIHAFFFLSENDVFPGLRSISPTVGAAMIIFSGHYGNGLPTRLLALKPLVWIGLISYSAYLWHWPLIAFYRYGSSEITLISGIVIFISTILMAFLSYRFVETPCRRSTLPALPMLIRQFIVPGASIAFLALLSMKIDGYGLRWFSDSYKSKLTTLRDEARPSYKYDYVCQSQVITLSDVDDDKCVLGGKADENTSVILWGDSNAAHYIGIIGEIASKADFSFRNLEIGSCPPIAEDASAYVHPRRTNDCNASREIAINSVMQYPVIIISANWPSYQMRSERFLGVFFDQVKSLADQGKLIIILGKGPIISGYDRLCREKQISYPAVSCEAPSLPLAESVQAINSKLKAYAVKMDRVEYYDFNRFLCPNEMCSLYDRFGKVMYFDRSHLSMSSSWSVGREIVGQEGVPFPFSRIPVVIDQLRASNVDKAASKSNQTIPLSVE